MQKINMKSALIDLTNVSYMTYLNQNQNK